MATKSTPDDSSPGEAAPGEQQPPLLKVVNADATPEEIAALVAVFASLGGTEPEPPRRTPEWAAHHRKVRGPHHHGPGGWRSSGLPR